MSSEIQGQILTSLVRPRNEKSDSLNVDGCCGSLWHVWHVCA